MALQDHTLAHGQDQAASTSDTPSASLSSSLSTPLDPGSYSPSVVQGSTVTASHAGKLPPTALSNHANGDSQRSRSSEDDPTIEDELSSSPAAPRLPSTSSKEAHTKNLPDSVTASPRTSSLLTSSTDISPHTASSTNGTGLDTPAPSSALRQRKTATAQSSASNYTNGGTEKSPSSDKMFGSTPTSSYLPLNRRQVGPPTSSYLISWLAKHKTFVVFVIVAMVVSVQILLVGPIVMDMEPVKKFKEEKLPAWKPPTKWFEPSAESPESWFPSTTSPAAQDPVAAIDKVDELGPNSFPPPYSVGKFAASHPDQASLYRDTNPHRGELPTYLESLLNTEAVLQPPPWPFKAPSITPEIWTTRTWSERSKTEASDAERPDLQPAEPEWRSSPYNNWKAPVDQLSKPSATLPKVQHAFEDASKYSGRRNDQSRDELIAHRQKMVRNAFLHAWGGYKKHAWGHDELKPVSKTAQDPFNGWGASIVDALDTLLVMGLPGEYDLARQHVRDIDFRLVGGGRSAYGSADGQIPVFETAIRYLGGFLSAYDLSGDVLMRDRAEELAQLILPAFDTVTGVPMGRIRMIETEEHPYMRPRPQNMVVLAEAGSLLLEFTRLWQVTGNRTYFDRVQRNTDWLDRNMTHGRMETLFPTMVHPDRNQAYGTISFGGMADSYYEYLIKEHQLLGGRLPQYSRMYSDAIEGAKKLLITKVDTVPGVNLMTVGEISGSRYLAKLEHLMCFSGGMLGLGSRIMTERTDDIELAKGIAGTCWWAYNSSTTGIGPENLVFYRSEDDDRFETITLPDGTSRRGAAKGQPIVGVRSVHPAYLNRPETIESVFYMWRITGDPVWQERGWQMFASWVTHCMTDAGFSAIYDVNRSPADWADSMESFTFAETFKYYYLLFSPPELISLDEYVFTTEAHPLLVPKEGKWAKAGQGSKSFWDVNASEDSHLPSPTSGSYSGGERGQVGGLTNNQKQMLWTQWQTKNSAHKIRDLITGFGGDALKNKLRSLVDRSSTASSSSSSTTASDPTSTPSPVETDSTQPSSDEAQQTSHEGYTLLASIAGTSVYAAPDGALEVEFAEHTDAARQEEILDKLEESYETILDADSAAQLLRSIEAVQQRDEEERYKAEQQAAMIARLRSKGIR